MSVITAYRPTKKPAVGHLGGGKVTGISLNGKDLHSVRDILLDYYDVEYLYLRENELTQFDCDIKLDYLRVLDLSVNSIGGAVDFLSKTPRLHHLYMTGNRIETLMGISNFAALETLCLSDNAISSFEGLENLPSLRVLSLNFNNISTFESYPTLLNLHTLNLVGNPITEVPFYRSMAIAINSNTLVTIDGNPVQEGERAAVEHYEGKIAHCIRGGFVAEGDNVEEAAHVFLLRAQRQKEKSKYLQLCAIQLSSMEEGSTVLTEGVPVTLSLCMQDVRPYTERTSETFYSPHLYPVVFQLSGRGTEVFLVGSMNNWTDPIELERYEKDDEIYFQTTLYLPVGDYEYRYIVDGTEKVSDTNRITSKYKQGFCNLYQVTEQKTYKKNCDTILHVRWMRSNASGIFEIIENENSLTYTPTPNDINTCLRAEVLAYVKGNFSFLYFDISSPIVAAPPRCASLVIKGTPMERYVLKAEAKYSGGVEGHSSITWFRVPAVGEEVPIDLRDPWEGYKLTQEDIGCRIRVEFTPVRDDWIAGEPRSVITEPVAAGLPECDTIKIIGNLYEGLPLEVEAVYSGGEEGNSIYQWLRKVDGSTEEYVPIEGATETKYVTTLQDIGKCLAVEYTPVNSDGVCGETCRCVLESPIEPSAPLIQDLVISGDLREGHVLTLEFLYSGGNFGPHMIQWYRHDPNKRTPVKVGQTNDIYLILTKSEVGCFIEASITPVRSDGVRGKTVKAKSKAPVAAGETEVRLLNIIGEPEVDHMLGIQVEYMGGEEGESNILWEVENPDTMNFETVAQGVKQYMVTPKDAGKMLKVTYMPIRQDGVAGEPKSRLVQIRAAASRVDQIPERHTDPTPHFKTDSNPTPLSGTEDVATAAIIPTLSGESNATLNYVENEVAENASGTQISTKHTPSDSHNPLKFVAENAEPGQVTH